MRENGSTLTIPQPDEDTQKHIELALSYALSRTPERSLIGEAIDGTAELGEAVADTAHKAVEKIIEEPKKAIAAGTLAITLSTGAGMVMNAAPAAAETVVSRGATTEQIIPSKGDTVSGLTGKRGVPENAMKNSDGTPLANRNLIYTNKTYTIDEARPVQAPSPSAARQYDTLQRGETLWSKSVEHHIPISVIERNNPALASHPNSLPVGSKVDITPASAAATAVTMRGNVWVPKGSSHNDIATAVHKVTGAPVYKVQAEVFAHGGKVLHPGQEVELDELQNPQVRAKVQAILNARHGVPAPSQPVSPPAPVAPAAPQPAEAAPAPVTQSTYILGDSIGEGLHQDGLEQKLQVKTGGAVVIDYDSGRSITQPGTEKHQSALTAVDSDQEAIKSATNIVIELGTNPTDDPFADNFTALITKMKTLAPQAHFYVVDIGATRSNTVETWNQRNKVIYDNAGSMGYTVISRAKALFGNNTDPTNLPVGADIPGSSDHVHGGYDQLAQAIVNSLPSKPAAPPPEAKPMPPTPLPAQTNDQKVMDYFVGKGYSPAQAAGIVGNMYAESGVQPERLQGTASGVTTPAESIPSWKLHNRNTGWGLVQWTPAGKMVDQARAAGKDPNDLNTQLDFLAQQLGPGGSEQGAGDALRAATSASDAAVIFERKFERPANPRSTQQFRMQKAEDVLNTYTLRMQGK